MAMSTRPLTFAVKPSGSVSRPPSCTYMESRMKSAFQSLRSASSEFCVHAVREELQAVAAHAAQLDRRAGLVAQVDAADAELAVDRRPASRRRRRAFGRRPGRGLWRLRWSIARGPASPVAPLGCRHLGGLLLRRAALLVQRAGRQALGVQVGLRRVAPDRRLDPVDRGEPLVLQRAEDRVLDEVRAALADRGAQPVVGLGDLRVEQLRGSAARRPAAGPAPRR